jgi:hypothetical protein
MPSSLVSKIRIDNPLARYTPGAEAVLEPLADSRDGGMATWGAGPIAGRERDAIELKRRRYRGQNQETEAPTPNGRGADRTFMPTCYKACPLPF